MSKQRKFHGNSFDVWRIFYVWIKKTDKAWQKVHPWLPSSLLQELDIPSETIVLADTKEDVAANDLSGRVPGDRGRYIFYLFKHTFEGDFLESVGKREIYSYPFLDNSVLAGAYSLYL